jgi:HAD superfamily hydrolase (TIGR01549 family)
MLFDVDGTLADSLPVCLVAFREAIRTFTGRELTDAEIVARFGPTEEGMIQRLVPERWESCLEGYLDGYRRALAEYPASLPAMAEALERLRARGLTLGVVTGKGYRSAILTLDRLGLAGYFAVVEAGSPDGSIKSACIRRVLAHWGLRPDRVAYVGDTASDVHAAREAGVLPLGAAWVGTTDARALRAAAPQEVFDTVEHFIQWIEEHVEFARRCPPTSFSAPA